MVIDTPIGKMEEFQVGECRHRFPFDETMTEEQREVERKYQWWKFEKYINDHKQGLILV